MTILKASFKSLVELRITVVTPNREADQARSILRSLRR